MESDYLVALSYSSNSEGRLLAISWCAYHIINKTTSEESSLFISPSGEEIEDLFMSGELSSSTGLNTHDMSSAQDLPSAMQCLNKAFYETIILKNANFTLLTYRDTLLCQILPDECARLGLKLAPHFQKYFDICSEFEKKYPDAGANITLNEMLQHLGMIKIPERIIAQQECKTMIRLISRLLKDGHSFTSPKDVNSEKAKPKVVTQKPVKKPSCILEIPVPSRVVVMKGAKQNSEEYEIQEFFYGLRTEKIISVLDPYGEKTELFMVKFSTEEDALEALLYDKRRMKKRLITGKDYAVESVSEEMFQMIFANGRNEFTGEKVFILKSREKSIPGVVAKMTYFFADYYYFVVEDKAEFSSSQSVRVDDQELMGHLRVNHSVGQIFLTSEQSSRAVKILGFLYTIKKSEVIEFLRDFEVFPYNVIIRRGIKEKAGLDVVVILNTAEERDRVHKNLSNRLFRNRLIEIQNFG